MQIAFSLQGGGAGASPPAIHDLVVKRAERFQWVLATGRLTSDVEPNGETDPENLKGDYGRHGESYASFDCGRRGLWPQGRIPVEEADALL